MKPGDELDCSHFMGIYRIGILAAGRWYDFKQGI